ncbi:MAG: hypothetical protein ACOY5F_18875 [Pseudomonadota bacterium]
MAVTIKQTESAPSSYPVIDGLSEAAAPFADVAWQRIESYSAFRSTVRDVVWIVEGCGEWSPRLMPATIATVEVWSRAGVWEACELPASPLGGYWLAASGPYRFTGSAGSTPSPDVIPAAIKEAVRRLCEYMAARAGKQGATRESVTAGSVNVSTSRSASWMAEALQNSGAADLLRPYRRA